MLKRYDKILYEALIEKDLASEKMLEPFVKEIESQGSSLQQVLVKRRVFNEKDILGVFAEKLKLPYFDLGSVSVEREVLDKVLVKIASYYKFLPIKLETNTLTIAVSFPLDIKTQDEIRTQLGYDIELVFSCSEDILEGLKKYYGLAADTLESIVSQQDSQFAVSSQPVGQEKVEDLEKLAEKASVIKLVNQIILEGWRRRATDIHIEPSRQSLSLRYRVDGVLYDATVLPEMKSFLNAIISRIKIMSNLNIVERRLPQDGRTVVKAQGQVLDLRISTIPTPFGESVVIRILPTKMLFSLEKLGLSEMDLKIIEELVKRPYGIIFVTGPTGSGKTTTLYTCLGSMNTKEHKIITIEDPIEYEIPGITQMQVNPGIGLDFARGLRSILRHDPDVILVGEVRDLETAEIAIRVALTGHMVFSTLHTNDAVSGITRLVDIGVEPYLVSSSVEAFIAQRLVRIICPECKYEDKSALLELKKRIVKELHIKSTDEVKIFRAKGCSKCNLTGFFGRTGIYEIFLLDDTIKDLILKKIPANQVKRIAVSKGMRTLRQDGWLKVIAGITTPEEIMKVTSVEEQSGPDTRVQSISYPESFKSEDLGQSFPQDKRVYPRLDKKINLRYEVFKSKKKVSRRGFKAEQFSVTKNISAGGLLFVSDEALAIGSILELKIELPDAKGPIECLTRVLRVEETEENKKYDIAVCFLDITSAQRVRLNKYVGLGIDKE